MSVCLDIYLNNKWMDVRRNCKTSAEFNFSNLESRLDIYNLITLMFDYSNLLASRKMTLLPSVRVRISPSLVISSLPTIWSVVTKLLISRCPRRGRSCRRWSSPTACCRGCTSPAWCRPCDPRTWWSAHSAAPGQISWRPIIIFTTCFHKISPNYLGILSLLPRQWREQRSWQWQYVCAAAWASPRRTARPTPWWRSPPPGGRLASILVDVHLHTAPLCPWNLPIDPASMFMSDVLNRITLTFSSEVNLWTHLLQRLWYWYLVCWYDYLKT